MRYKNEASYQKLAESEIFVYIKMFLREVMLLQLHSASLAVVNLSQNTTLKYAHFVTLNESRLQVLDIK